MTEKINNAQHWLSANASRLSGSEIVVKTSTTFIFTKAKLNSAKYQGKNGSHAQTNIRRCLGKRGFN